MTSSPFFSVKRWTGGSASSVGLGGAGACMRSLRPSQYAVSTLFLGAPGALSYCTCTADAGGAGGGGGFDAQPARRTRSVAHEDEDEDEDVDDDEVIFLRL